ncbi:5-formyltetrahydrofolate cyclo-ligase [Blattabacterium cuenoti]|uniref:5-formyltetrahydrofolate cyclo-ligase n=1 Tax=Blattabacterium cuenoti TaxID=1653831 RepID=UPI00163D31BE|nr:5-formyltetrahydrofolate cyclo-ligase [Blattabacterium cuenoti]
MIFQKKIDIRKKYLFYRKYFFTEKNINFFSKKIFFQLKKLPIWNKKYYHIFIPIKKYREINTFIIINFLLKKKSKCVVTIPFLNFYDNSIKNCLFNKKITLKKNKYGILEPIYKKYIPPSCIEIIFIPLLIFDSRGYRIGYGKGFYDRFITKCSNNIIKIGLSIFNPLNNLILDIHKNDLILDIGVTPNKIFFFKNEKI